MHVDHVLEQVMILHQILKSENSLQSTRLIVNMKTGFSLFLLVLQTREPKPFPYPVVGENSNAALSLVILFLISKYYGAFEDPIEVKAPLVGG